MLLDSKFVYKFYKALILFIFVPCVYYYFYFITIFIFYIFDLFNFELN